ncbi:MAG: GGDEF domain-containing protein [Alkaliphilus sp.]|nr:GGDEF domain-containing protein [Alkaliphilus sp.]
MKEIPKKDWSLTTIKKKIITMFRNNSSILDECTLINIKRIYYLSLIIIPSRILHILLFVGSSPTSKAWARGIIFSHSVLLVFWIVVLFVTYRLKDKTQTNTFIHFLQYIVVIVTMASGVVIVAIDQMITTNITPLLTVSIVIGAVFLIRPLISAIIYFSSYMAYYYLIALTITNQQVLLSNRVNGTTVVSIGFLISVMIWYYNYTNITQRKHIEMQQKQLERLAYYDPLTNLYNRHFFNKIIEKEFSYVQRYGHKSAIIILDIDDFKNINDTYGHLVGDQVLKQLTKLIVGNVRESDTVSRFGGEEFIILAPKISLDGGVALAEKLRKLIAENEFVTGATTSYITASFGVSLLRATEKYGPENYFSLADKALYLAKKRGKNRVEKAL